MLSYTIITVIFWLQRSKYDSDFVANIMFSSFYIKKRNCRKIASFNYDFNETNT